MKKLVLLVSTVLVLVVLNVGIVLKERIVAHGEIVLLELAPVDPRSLMQGDYMRLRYAIERPAGEAVAAAVETSEPAGWLVITLDADRVGRFARLWRGEPLAAGEKRLRFHTDAGRIEIVPDSFLFEEGRAALYARAKYGVFRFDDAGEHVLVGLADATRRDIRPE